eukprot:COSAG01_NODE_66416_length_270_cov_0.608187_1_plen_28_part_01
MHIADRERPGVRANGGTEQTSNKLHAVA